MTIFETERLVVVPWSIADADQALSIYSSVDVCKGLGNDPLPDVASAVRLLESWEDRAKAWPPGMGIWAMQERASCRKFGSILLKPLPDSDLIEVGWHLGRSFWGHGFATEAGAGALRYGFDVLRLPAIYAIAFPWNTKSLAVMERLGMAYQGLTTEYHDIELALYKIDNPSDVR